MQIGPWGGGRSHEFRADHALGCRVPDPLCARSICPANERRPRESEADEAKVAGVSTTGIVGVAMKPPITATSFGSITVGDLLIEHDIIIRLSGEIKKRKKKLSKSVYGTSHTISLEEAKHVYEKGAKRIIIGSGQENNVRLSEEARDYFEKKDCKVDLMATPRAVQAWNKAKSRTIGLFHVTC